MPYQRFNLRNKIHRDAERAIDFLYEYVDNLSTKITASVATNQQSIQAVSQASSKLVDSFATRLVGGSSTDPLLETLGTGTGTVTSVTAGTGLTGGPVTTSGSLSLANTAVTPATYTNPTFTVDAQGRLTAASNTYLVYSALLTQTGTNAPVATVLANTLGGTVVWARTSAGLYTATLAGVFTSAKTLVIASGGSGSATLLNGVRTSNNVVTLTSWDSLNTIVDDSLITNSTLEIRVYP